MHKKFLRTLTARVASSLVVFILYSNLAVAMDDDAVKFTVVLRTHLDCKIETMGAAGEFVTSLKFRRTNGELLSVDQIGGPMQFRGNKLSWDSLSPAQREQLEYIQNITNNPTKYKVVRPEARRIGGRFNTGYKDHAYELQGKGSHGGVLSFTMTKLNAHYLEELEAEIEPYLKSFQVGTYGGKNYDFNFRLGWDLPVLEDHLMHL